MFSKGQQLFALFFIIAFIGIMIWSYRKDITIHKKYYKWTWFISLLAIILIITAFAIVTFVLHE